MREHLRAVEKAVLSMPPGTGPSASLPPREGGWSGESTVRSSMPPMCGIHIVYFPCVFVCLRFALVCIVFVICMGPRMRNFRAYSNS